MGRFRSRGSIKIIMSMESHHKTSTHNKCPVHTATNSSVSNTVCMNVPQESSLYSLKGLVHPKMKILSVFTHPHVVPTPLDLRSSSENRN